MRKLLITHNDLDAIGCIVVSKIYKQDFDHIYCMNYDEYEKEEFNYDMLLRFDKVVYADFSPDLKSILILYENNIPVIIYDHHESFYDLYLEIKNSNEYPKDLFKNIEYKYDNDHCGAYIYLDNIKQGRVLNSLIEFIDIVNGYDMWKWKDPLFETSLNLQRVLWKYVNWKQDNYGKYEKVVQVFVNRIQNNPTFSFNKEEKDYIINAILLEKKVLYEAKKKLLVRTDMKGNKFGIVRLSKKVSFTLFNILRQRKDLEYIIGINTYNESRTGELKISIRSLDNFNCLQLQYAKGHKNACGCEKNDIQFINDLWYGKIYELGYIDEN